MGDQDTKIIYTASTYIHYQKLKLNDLYKHYLEMALVFFQKKKFRTGLQKLVLQKVYKIKTGVQPCTVNFTAANRSLSGWKFILFMITARSI